MGINEKRYFINTLGIGLDAEIANETKHIKFIRGLPLYLLAAIKALLTHSPNEYYIKDGDVKRTIRAFFICIGNGNFEGGGFKILPDAKANDSNLDICLIGAIPIFKAIRIIPSLINGTHKKNQNVSMWKTKQMTIEAKKPFIIHGDGEIFDENTRKVKIEIRPKIKST